MKPWDVLFIGSGISALTCAAFLAKKGKSVCLLEQHDKPGGYLHCFNRFGTRYDTGSHYVGAMEKGQPFHTLLDYLGVYDEDFFVPLDPDGFDVFRFPSYEARLAKGYEGSIKSLMETFPGESAAIRGYFDLVKSTAEKFPTYQFNEFYDEAGLSSALETPLATIVDSLTTNPRLKNVLYAHCVNHGVTPEEISFGLHSLVVDSLIRGPFGFKSGGDALSARFVERLRELGGEVKLSTKVTRLVTENKSVTEVHTSTGEIFRATHVISAAHPKATFRLMDATELTPAFRTRLDNLRESAGIFGIYATCDRRVELSATRNYFFFRSDEPAPLIDDSGPLDAPTAVYVSCTDRVGTSKALPLTFHSPGPIHWFEPWQELARGKRPAEYRELKKKMAENVIRFVDGYVPGLGASVKRFDSSSPLTNIHYNGSEEGSAYGIYHSLQYTGFRALGPRTHFKNLLLTGQNCLFPGLLGAAISGLRTAGHLIGIKPLLKELRLRGESV